MNNPFYLMYMNIVIGIFCVLLFVIIFVLSNKCKSNKVSSNIKCMHKQHGVEILIINNKESCIDGINELLSHKPQFVGYDCEWKANRCKGQKQNKICLIQIGHKNLILLIRIHLFANNIPIQLISLLQSVDIIKCGVGIYGDVKKLKKDYNLDIFGCVDLNAINTMHFDTNQSFIGLEKFAKKILNQTMDHKHKINHDRWENEQLTQIQIHYAADDAFIAYKIFEKIIETQYNENQDIMEICFGKIDTNLFNKTKCKYKSKNKQKSKAERNKTNRYLKSDKKHGMINCLQKNGEFLSNIPTKVGKLFLRKNWAKKLNLQTIQMNFKVDPINIEHDDLYKYVRVLTMLDYCCIICGQKATEDKEEWGLIWHSLLPRLHNVFPKNGDDPYRVLLCKKCDRYAKQVKHQYQQELQRLSLEGHDEKMKYIDTLYKTRNICWNLKHRNKRFSFSVSEQNKFVQEILKYCKIENPQDFVIKECDFNTELDIDWYCHYDGNNNDYKYVIIRDCIDKICKERQRNRKQHNEYKKKSLTDLWANRRIEYAEMWRKNFMVKCKPKYVNSKQETFEICVDKLVDEELKNIQRMCKHKIVDCNGKLLTRSTLALSERLCGNAEYDRLLRKHKMEQKPQKRMNGNIRKCICSKDLEKLRRRDCYNGDSVTCDGCDKSIGGRLVYHCPDGENDVHQEGYDLCRNCAEDVDTKEVVEDKDEEKKEKEKKIMPFTLPMAPKELKCICGVMFEKIAARECYNGKQVVCDGCNYGVISVQKVYHCPDEKSNVHRGGYDLCLDCAANGTGLKKRKKMKEKRKAKTSKKAKGRKDKDNDKNKVVAVAKRIGSKTVQLLREIENVNVDIENDEKDEKVSTCIVWMPFVGTECFNCKCDENLKIFNIFPDDYYEKLKENYCDGKRDLDEDYPMQYYVPLCVQCEVDAKRIQNEFELYLSDKYSKKDKDDTSKLEFYAFKLSQKSERFKLSITEQNNCIQQILTHFGIDDMENNEILKESHCNKELGIDWYYINNYNYIIIKECINKLINAKINKEPCMNELCQIYKGKELEFIQLWIDNFSNKMTSISQTRNSAFQIQHK